jgi:hypothetical protein
MKNILDRSCLTSALTGLALFAMANVGRAQTTNYVLNVFNDESEAANWARWWGAAAQTYEFDATVDANNSKTSGSLKATIVFDPANGDNQFAVNRYINPAPPFIDGTKYTHLSMDIRYAPGSPTRASGDFGFVEYGLIPQNYSQLWLGSITVPGTNTGWVHINAPIDPTAAGLASIRGVVLKVYAGAGLTGTSTMWVDNVTFIANTNTAPPPAPTLAVRKSAASGLQIFASAPGAQYQRQNIRTVNPAYSWLTSSKPVTYSITIADYNAAQNGFQTHMFLLPDPSGNATSPDWNYPNIIFLDIQNQNNGSANASFRYKVEEPNGNTMIYNTNPNATYASGNPVPVGTLATISNPTPLGKWSLTLSNNSVTLTTPSGTSTNFSMPAAHAAMFADPLYAYVGVQPNNANNIGRSATFSRISITGGVETPIDDTFASGFDTNRWQIIADNQAGINAVPPDSFWLIWSALTSPDYSVLQATTNLTSKSWFDTGLTVTSALAVGGQRMVVVGKSILKGANTGFFRLVKP